MRMALDNEQAFVCLYNKYWKFLFAIACKKLRCSAEAQEIVQDIFLDIWQRRAALQLTGTLSSYLSVAVNYKVMNVLAKRHLHEKYKAANTSHTQEAAYEIQGQLEFEEVKDRLSSLVNELPKKCRLVFQLSREQFMSGKEIAEQLQISEKTVESHITKALQHLRAGIGLSVQLIILFVK